MFVNLTVRTMPLQQIDLPARDDGLAVSFVMLDGARHIRCYAQQGTLDAIEQCRTGSGRERLERFSRHRAAFEAVASDLYDAGLPLRITADHMTWLQRCSGRRRQAAA